MGPWSSCLVVWTGLAKYSPEPDALRLIWNVIRQELRDDNLLNDAGHALNQLILNITSLVSLVGLLLLLGKAASWLLEEIEVCLSQNSVYKFV